MNNRVTKEKETYRETTRTEIRQHTENKAKRDTEERYGAHCIRQSNHA
jgi:hypothetical protein